jgi:hypothetical protein
MKQVTVIQTGSPAPKVIETNASTWEELTNDLSRNQVNFNSQKMKAIIGETKHTLESPNATLPNTNFSLFLMVKKSKAGADVDSMSYKECRTTIKNIIDSADDTNFAKGFFADGLKNYTQTSTVYMKERLKAWLKKFGSSKTDESTTEDGEEVEKVESKKEDTLVKTDDMNEGVDIINDVRKRLKLVKKGNNISNDALCTLKAIKTLTDTLIVYNAVPTVDEILNEFGDLQR